MSTHVKTDYIFSPDDTPRTDSEKARRAIEAVREAVRVSQGLSIPKIENSIVSETAVVQEVTTYFSEPKFAKFSIHTEYEIQIGSARYRTDVVLRDAQGNFIAIAECKLLRGSSYGLETLKSFLCATDAPFGILASSRDRESWRFYENLRHNQFRQIEKSDFEKRVIKRLNVKRLRLNW